MRILISALLVGATSTFALAADLPSRRAPPVYVPPAVVPVFTWTGAYIGANAGYAFDNHVNYALSGNDAASQARIAAGARPGFAQTGSNGFTGGGQIGYNFELGGANAVPLLGSFGGLGGGGGLVAGVEADAAYTDLSNTTTYGTGVTSTFHSRTEYVGTVRGRLGVAFANALLYGTGGFAYGGVRNNIAFGGAAAPSGSSNQIKTGYAYGGGIEYAIPTSSFINVFNAGAVTVKAEYIRYQLGTDSLAVASGTGAYTARIKDEGNLVRAGVNYKFNFLGAPVAPVVARY